MISAKDIYPDPWEAKDNFIKPKQTLKKWFHHSPLLDLIAFRKFAKQHTYATDLPDGTYNSDDLGEVVWQYRDGSTDVPDEWSDENENAYKRLKDFASYSEHAKSYGDEYETRQFLTLKPHPMKEPVSSIDLSAVMYFRSHANNTLNGDDMFITTADRVIELMVGFHKSHLQP